MMYKVTIGIPVYNAAPYLRETMLSALAQTFESIEFLIVDDKSTDSSMEILLEMQRTHPRGKDMRIIQQKQNFGPAIARNTILDETQSKYLFLLDGDDLLTTDCIELLYKAITDSDSEVVYASYKEEWRGDTDESDSLRTLPPLIFEGEDELALFTYKSLRQSFRYFVWNVLYSTDFLRENKIKFELVRYWEDFAFSFDLIPHVRKAIFLPDITYIYVKHTGSVSQYYKRKKIPREEITEHIKIRKLCKEKCTMYRDKPYFDVRVTQTVIMCIDTVAVILDKKNMYDFKMPDKELKELLKHPLSLKEILKFRRYRTLNVLLYWFGNMPYTINKFSLRVYFQLITKYREWRNKK
ncbi:glycosyltransferase family A protein [Bacteroides sp. 51]|uniref:glycosyltransferase family 2 protein n=1 Tax=Bacteroides sp. 51 TaxID=2302938 RepID=UPI0013D54E69|nr:glycosyltransferase family A protein [Bacteroides sp. 51]NDV82677.1 glycosyltransferase family 2 protein [Bacteroides sp. 51]